ncbi:MAG: hypothetical protein QXX06_00280 [Candidatus Diapherotrites archaeon]
MKTLNDDTHQIWGDFTNQYSLQKTIRFELKPIGKTREHIFYYCRCAIGCITITEVV